MSKTWITRIKVLVISALFASVANAISTRKSGAMVSPLESLPGLAIMFAMVIVGCLLQEFAEKVFKFHMPTIIYISLISVSALKSRVLQSLLLPFAHSQVHILAVRLLHRLFLKQQVPYKT